MLLVRADATRGEGLRLLGAAVAIRVEEIPRHRRSVDARGARRAEMAQGDVKT
jgi:hypothetical protein